MIEHYATESGGSVKVKSLNGSAHVSFSYSNPQDTLSLWCRIQPHSDTQLSAAIISNLAERYTPCVLTVFTEDTGLRFKPKYWNLSRGWTHKSQSVFVESMSAKSQFQTICVFAAAMGNTDFIREKNGEIDFYSRADVLRWLNERCSPMEFVALKEECDYRLRKTAADCVESLLESATDSLLWLNSDDAHAFESALGELKRRQSKEHGFDTRYAHIQEFCTAIAMPALVRLGGDNPFTAQIWEDFCKFSTSYLADCDQLMRDYSQMWEENSSIADDTTT
jgi:hypothetical protein